MQTSPARSRPLGALVAVGSCAGFVVGLADGARAGVAVGADATGVACAALLAASTDALLALPVFGCIAALVFVLRVSRLSTRRPRRSVEVAVAVVFGLGAGLAAFAALMVTEARRNRLLATGIVAGAAIGVAAFGACATPTLARALSRLAPRRRDRRAPDPDPGTADAPAPPVRGASGTPSAVRAIALVVVATLAGAGVQVVASQVRLPVRAARAWPAVLGLAVLCMISPAALLWASRLPGRRLSAHPGRLVRIAAAVGVAWALGVAAFVRASWEHALRFLPWTHVGVAAAILLLTWLALLPRAARVLVPDWPPRRWWSALGPWLVACALVTLATSELEPARKAIFARAGLAGPTLLAARAGLDRDGDGYARWLGGGDCDDGDSTIHPGVLDDPDDGIDQDCDGEDAHAGSLPSARMAPVPEAVPRALNLLLITIDTLRADHLGCYGYPRPTSPALDRLAAEGSLFVNGWAHAPSTRYSMPAIATGRWPSAIAWDESIWWPRIEPGVRTLGEAMKSAGYVTAAFYSFDYFALADHRGFERGIDFYRADRAVLHRSVNGPMESRGSSSREMADDAIAFFEAHRGEKVFLWVHFYDPHLSYEPHAEVPSFGSSRVDLYDGEIRFTDLHVGRLLGRLRELGLWERTAVVVTGDHGEGFGEHGVTEHGFDLYAAQTKVPLIVRVPGLPARRVERPAGHVDLAPTLLNLARGAPEPSFLGRSLLPELSGASGASPADPGSDPDPTVASQEPAVFQEVTSERGKKRALVTRDLHLIWNWTPDNTTECYDRRTDPGELHDLWGRRSAAPCRLLKATLGRLVSVLAVPPELGAKLARGVFAPGFALAAPQVALDARVGSGVRVLGYTASPLRVHPGEAVHVQLQLECLAPVPSGWRAFFHLRSLGTPGFFRNLDHVPVEGTMPFERWRPGFRFVDRFEVVLPEGAPPGRYGLFFGMFRGTERMPVTPAAASDGAGAVRILELELL